MWKYVYCVTDHAKTMWCELCIRNVQVKQVCFPLDTCCIWERICASMPRCKRKRTEFGLNLLIVALHFSFKRTSAVPALDEMRPLDKGRTAGCCSVVGVGGQTDSEQIWRIQRQEQAGANGRRLHRTWKEREVHLKIRLEGQCWRGALGVKVQKPQGK
ncbi:uncharacterized protein LOC115633108 [Scaptodrosophila lebanonensis]|uniref:Uncharacterized protein LOC115633108 n=1 Tax=Drosophila lebanonensis TaxID=7225 RepID=A0A6J2UDD0_DROLE|nr:uncharacterized protein LOC115633108 [Scaptodrosophila lebanonensis]